jgi:hypothetical protein
VAKIMNANIWQHFTGPHDGLEPGPMIYFEHPDRTALS